MSNGKFVASIELDTARGRVDIHIVVKLPPRRQDQTVNQILDGLGEEIRRYPDAQGWEMLSRCLNNMLIFSSNQITSGTTKGLDGKIMAIKRRVRDHCSGKHFKTSSISSTAAWTFVQDRC